MSPLTCASWDVPGGVSAAALKTGTRVAIASMVVSVIFFISKFSSKFTLLHWLRQSVLRRGAADFLDSLTAAHAVPSCELRRFDPSLTNVSTAHEKPTLSPDAVPSILTTNLVRRLRPRRPPRGARQAQHGPLRR